MPCLGWRVALSWHAPTQHAIRGGVFHQVLHGASAPLPRDHQRPVLHPGALVTQVEHVRAGRALRICVRACVQASHSAT
jgi:hypothetical protein